MRHFFIRSLDILIGGFTLIGLIGVLIAAFAAYEGGIASTAGVPVDGTAAAIGILIVGTLYIAFVAGFLYLGVGIYHNTKRTAEAVEKLSMQKKAHSGSRSEPPLSR